MQSIQASQVKLSELKQKFGLMLVEDPNFFLEWSTASSDVTELEKYWLDRVKSNFVSLLEDLPVLKNSVKLLVLSPLLDLAGFYQKPFRLETETSFEVEAEDDSTIIRGRIDILVLHKRLWLLVVESKQGDFSVHVGTAQALAGMLSTPAEQPTFGMITNGIDFLFLKRMQNQYANSRIFSLVTSGNELYIILGILKQMGAAIAS